VQGSAVPGLTVTLHRHPSGADAPLATAVVGSSGYFEVEVAVSPDQLTMLYARTENEDGVLSEMSEALTYVHDGIAPDMPVLSGTDPVTPGATAFPLVVGSAEPGATVEIYVYATCAGAAAGTGMD
jgi:hypothetical protein